MAKTFTTEDEQLHALASDFVIRNLRTPDSPTMELAPLSKCHAAFTELVCPIYGMDVLKLTNGQWQALWKTFGAQASIYSEYVAQEATTHFKLRLPRNAHFGGRMVAHHHRSHQSWERPLLCLVIGVCLCIVMYFRWDRGTLY